MKISAQARSEFDTLLEATIASLPENVREMLNEVPVIVEDEPSVEIQKDMDAYLEGGPSDLCGLHWGIPLTEQSIQDQGMSPVILIFRGPILRLADKDRRTLKEQIEITLLHEIAHHFGFSEEQLEEIGYG